MAAVTGILNEPITLGDSNYPVAEQSAQVPHFLRELRSTGKSVSDRREHERMAAPYARVLVDCSR